MNDFQDEYGADTTTEDRGLTPTPPKDNVFSSIEDQAKMAEDHGDMAVGIINTIAASSAKQSTWGGLVEGAKQGKTVKQQLEEIAKYEEANRQIALKRSQNTIAPTDMAGYNQAEQAYTQEMGNSPVQPDMVHGQSTDLEKIIGAIAAATGTPIANIMRELGSVANNRANQTNQENMNKFGILDKKHQDAMAQKRWQLQTEGARADRQDANNIREFQARDRSYGGQVDDFQHEIDTRHALIQSDEKTRAKAFDTAIELASKNRDTKFNKSADGWTEADDKLLQEESFRIASVHHAEGASDDDIKAYANQIYNHLNIYRIGEKTRVAANQDRQFKFKVDKETWDREFKGKTFDQRQSMFDKKFEEQVRQFEQLLGRNLTNDEWRKSYQQGMMEISQNRETRLQGTLGGSTTDGVPQDKPVKPPTPQQKATALKRIGELQKDIATFPDNEDEWTPEQRAKSDEFETLDTWIHPTKGNVNPVNVQDVLTGGIGAFFKPGGTPKGSLPPATGTVNGKPKTVKVTAPKTNPNQHPGGAGPKAPTKTATKTPPKGKIIKAADGTVFKLK